MPKNAQIVVTLVQPSDLPPGTDAEFTVLTKPSAVHATLRCSSAQAARDCFLQMLSTMRHA